MSSSTRTLRSRRRDGLWESRIQQDKRVSSRPTSQSLFKMLKFLKSNCTCSLFAAWTLCLANFFKLDWDAKIFNRNYASDLYLYTFYSKLSNAHLNFLILGGQSF